MAESGAHIINRQIFDITYRNEKNAHKLQNRISDLSKNNLTKIISDLLDKYDNPNIHLFLDQIELDLGPIHEEDLERDILSKTKEALDLFLEKRISEIKDGKGPSSDNFRSTSIKQIDLLEWFLINGTLPWWHSDIDRISIKSIIEKLMLTQQSSVISIIQKQEKKQGFIQRLVLNFSDNQLESIVKSLRPNEAENIIKTKHNITKVHTEKPIAGGTNSNFKHKVWELIFDYLFNERGTLFNTKMFVRHLLSKLSNHFNTTFKTFIDLFNNAIQTLKAPLHLPSEFVGIIQQLQIENAKDEAEKAIPLQLSESDEKWLIKQLKGHLNYLNESAKQRLKQILQTKRFEQQPLLLQLLVETLKTTQGLRLVKELEINTEPITALFATNTDRIKNRFSEESSHPVYYYLKFGSLLPKHFSQSFGDFKESLTRLIRINSLAFYQFILKEGKNQTLRKRLLQDLTDTTIQKLVALIEPNNSAVIIQFATKIDTLPSKKNLKSSISHRELKKRKWDFIFSALLVDRGSLFNLKSFVKSTLTRMASDLNMNFHALIAAILKDIPITKSINSNDFSNVMLELRNEEFKIIKNKEKEKEALEKNTIMLQWFTYIVSRASVPWWGKKSGLSLNQFEVVLFSLGKTHKEEIRTILLRHLLKFENRNFVIYQLKETGTFELIKNIAPKQLEQVKFYAKVLDQLKQTEKTTQNKTAFNSKKWDIIIFDLIAERGSRFNYKSFMIRTLHQLANHFNSTFEVLFEQLITFSETFTTVQNSDFITALSELKTTYLTQKTKQIASLPAFEKEWAQLKNSTDEKYYPLFQLLLHFKQNINWSFSQKKVLKKWFNGHSKVPTVLLRHFFRATKFTPNELFLFFRQFEPKEQQLWLRELIEEETLFIRYYLNDIEKLIAVIKTQSLEKLQQLIQGYSLAYLMHSKIKNKHHYFEAVYTMLIEYWGIPKRDAVKKLDAAINELKTKFSSTLPLSYSKMRAGINEENETLKNPISKLENSQELAVEEKLNIPYKTEAAVASPENKETVLITNAGLVVVWPFLQRFFQMLNLLDKEAFIDEEAQLTAVHLLQFLVTGKEHHPEHDLYLNKLLCGINTTTPIIPDFDLTNQQKETSESLLAGVISNWPILKDSSIEALRESFLQREATIAYREDIIELRVEKKTLDILLDSLPWGYTLVKLPWMKQAIHVVWR